MTASAARRIVWLDEEDAAETLATPARRDRWARSVWLNAISARLVFLLPFVFTRALGLGGLQNTGDRPLPGLTALLSALGDSARSYGDYGWYTLLAQSGYAARPYLPGQITTAPFFPLQAGLIRLVHYAPLVDFVLATGAFLLSARLVYAVLSRVTSRPTAHRATLFLVYFPFSFCVAQFRPEASLLCLGAGATLLSLQGRPWLAAVAGLAAGFTKPNAWLLGLLTGRTLLPARWRGAPEQALERPVATAAAAAAPFVGLFAMIGIGAVYSHEPLAFAKAQGAWLAAPVTRPLEEAQRLLAHPLLVGRSGWDPELLHWGVAAAAVAAIAALLRRRLYPYAAVTAGFVGLTFINFGVWMLGKHLAACFPLFLGLAFAVRGRGASTAWIALSAALLAANGVFNALGLQFTMV